jgi:hypothetical protein
MPGLEGSWEGGGGGDAGVYVRACERERVSVC